MNLERARDDEGFPVPEGGDVEEPASPPLRRGGPTNAPGEHPAGSLDDDPSLHRVSLENQTTERTERNDMQKWEYATVPLISHALQEILNQWGEEGWELVQVVESQATGTTAFFKREKA